MKPTYMPSWIWGFCWAMLPAAVAAMMVATQLETTHALGRTRRSKLTASISALSTHQALRVNTKTLDAGALVEGDKVHVQVVVRNVWDRRLRLDIDLQNLPGWTALLEQPVLGPGESTLLHLNGEAAAPGELNGRVRISAMGDYLSLRVGVRGQIAPKPPAPACAAGPSEEGVEPESLAPSEEGTEPFAEPLACEESAEPPAEVPEPPAEVPEPPAEVPEPPAEVPEPPAEVPDPPAEVPEPPAEVTEPPVETEMTPGESDPENQDS